MPNAGIGFLVDGLALIAIAWGRERLALGAAAWSLLLGSLTLVEYLFSVRLGIDQAFVRITDGSPDPGRIGPNVAFAFVLIGVVLWWASVRRREWKWLGAMGLLGTVVLATGAVSAIAGLIGVSWHSSWSQITPRIGAFDAAAGFALLGSGLLLVVWWRDCEQDVGFSRWLSVAVAIGGLAVALCFGHALTALNIDRMAEIAGEIGRTPEDVSTVVRAAQGNLPIMLASIGLLVTLLMIVLANQSQASRRQAVELERANAELRDFAFVASHDLQEPLRPIIAFSQLLAERYHGRLDADADDFIGYVVQGARRMHDLINGLLIYSRVDSRAAPLQSADCELVLASALANLAVAVEEAHASITHDPLPVVLADSSQLGQVFQNLIGNALKFRGSQPPLVHVSAERTPDAWRFSVRDNGIGIDAQFRDQIFSMFKRLHSNEDYPGTGVGLTICKRIVERHAGKIGVESEAGRGSTFWFSIPDRPGDGRLPALRAEIVAKTRK